MARSPVTFDHSVNSRVARKHLQNRPDHCRTLEAFRMTVILMLSDARPAILTLDDDGTDDQVLNIHCGLY